MKKFIAAMIVVLLAFTMCISASAQNLWSLDMISPSNTNDGTTNGTDMSKKDTIEIAVGTKLYILGWAVLDNNLKEAYYTIDGVKMPCANNYRARTDLAGFGSNIGHAGVGRDNAAFELVGIDELGNGTYQMQIVFESEAGEKFIGNDKTYTLKVGTGIKDATTPTNGSNSGSTSGTGTGSNPKTADVSVIAIATVACLALAGVVVAKKVR